MVCAASRGLASHFFHTPLNERRKASEPHVFDTPICFSLKITSHNGIVAVAIAIAINTTE